ncbi:10274_t:CDS:2, partial [Acaulospora colombiana]
YQNLDDELNQGAAQLAKTYDPEEQRTIGNADPEQNNPEAVAYWQKRARDDLFRNALGIFGYPSLRMDPEKVRGRSALLVLREYRPLIRHRRLPDLQKKARLRLHQMEVELESLPKPVDNPIGYMDNLIWEFNRKIEQATDIHKFHNPPLTQACRVRLEEFDDMLVYQLHPRFRPFSREILRKAPMKEYQEEHATPAEIPQMNRNIQIPEPIYLEEVMARS